MSAREKKQIRIFIAIAFIFNFLMAIPLYIAKSMELDLGLYPMLMMLMPASGVMLAALITRKNDPLLPKGFFILILIEFVIIFIMSIIPLFPISGRISGLINTISGELVIIVFAIIGWGFLIKNRGLVNKAYGLDKGRLKNLILMSVLFLSLYCARIILANYIETGALTLFHSFNYNHIVYLIIIIPNFFISFTVFLGEEYGWRYFLQPILQRHFGIIKGIILLGIIWGFWHIPLNFFFYSDGATGLQSLISQIGVCISLSIFMAYAYQKAGTIWAPVFIHYLNNNLIPLFLENPFDFAQATQGNEYTWSAVLFSWITGFILFSLFIFLKSMRNPKNQIPTMDERADHYLQAKEEINIETII